MHTLGIDNKLTINYVTSFCIYLLDFYYFILLLLLEYTTSNYKENLQYNTMLCCTLVSLNYKEKPQWVIVLYHLGLCSYNNGISYWCVSQNVAMLLSHMWLHCMSRDEDTGQLKKRFPLSRGPVALVFAGGSWHSICFSSFSFLFFFCNFFY